MKKINYQFTSESVSAGHPDKVADQISDAILDAYLTQDPNSKVACECLISTNYLLIAGEVTSTATVNPVIIAQNVLDKIGYNNDAVGFNWHKAEIKNIIHEQSPQIFESVKDGGAGDQGIMFGYACNDTPEFMPLAISLSHKILQKLNELRETNFFPWLRPDAKAQVTVNYNENGPVNIDTVVVSTQHDEFVAQKTIRDTIIEQVIEPIISKWLPNKTPKYLINPSGNFTIGGPHGDTGLTGRKIVVDTYGGSCPHGGGAFSGKDPSKVDRSAAYAARFIAKHIVAAGLMDKCTVQLSYAIGLVEPTSIFIDAHGTEKCDLNRLSKIVYQLFPVKPDDIINVLNLKSPIYFKTASYGHFNNENYPWEVLDNIKINELQSMTGVYLKSPIEGIKEYEARNERSKNCFIKFQNDPDYGHLKLKWLSKRPFTPVLNFKVPNGLVQFVEKSEFILDEKNERIPLFLFESHAGIIPKYESLPIFNDGALHLLISKSTLSGHVHGLKLNRWNEMANKFETIKEWQ